MEGYGLNVFRYGFYTDLDDDELLGYFPLKLEEYNTSGDFAEMDIIFNRRVLCLRMKYVDLSWRSHTRGKIKPCLTYLEQFRKQMKKMGWGGLHFSYFY